MNTAFNELRDEVMSMGTSRWAIAFGIAIVAGLAVTQVASAGIDGEQEVVCRYVLRYAWFEPAPVRHSEIFDPVVALKQPLARGRLNVAEIAYSYPRERRISFEFAWETPPGVLEMRRGVMSELYKVALEVRRGIGAAHQDEFASIGVCDGGQSVDVRCAEVVERLRASRILAETITSRDLPPLGFNHANLQLSALTGGNSFQLSQAGQYPESEPESIRYAYIRITMEARGGSGTAFYVYENLGLGSGDGPPPVVAATAPLPEGPGHLVSVQAEGLGRIAGPAMDSEPPLLAATFAEGLIAPWGTGQYSDRGPVWWNSGTCTSRVETDRHVSLNGNASLHIVNLSSRGPHVFGTTQRSVPVEPGRRYRISLWARARDIASLGALSIVVDSQWRVRPIQLPAGSYDWTEFSGEFSLTANTADLRILMEDRGEVWLDSIVIRPVE